jgi:hypothetical protein
LRHLDAVGEPGAEEVALMVDENLGLVLKSPEGGGMNDTVPIALVFAAAARRRLALAAAAGMLRPRRV